MHDFDHLLMTKQVTRLAMIQRVGKDIHLLKEGVAVTLGVYIQKWEELLRPPLQTIYYNPHYGHNNSHTSHMQDRFTTPKPPKSHRIMSSGLTSISLMTHVQKQRRVLKLLSTFSSSKDLGTKKTSYLPNIPNI